MTCPRCQHENHVAAKFCEECGTPLQRPEGNTQPAPSYADVQRSATEALEQQTATAEILRVISSSPADALPVFEAITESVVRLCNGISATVYRFDGNLIHLMAHHHSISSDELDTFRRVYPLPPSRTSVVAQAILDQTVIHVADLEGDLGIPLASREIARAVGHRSLLVVPMLRDGGPIGAISVGRGELNGAARPFLDREIALVQTFADQAVIAIENVRLFNETKEALEQQTATAEILQVISGSPTDLQPVFDTIVRSARRLCDAFDAVIYRRDGDTLHLVAHEGPIPTASMQALIRGWTPGRAVLDGRTVHIADIQAEVDEFPEGSEIARRVGNRTVLSMPLMGKDDLAIGAIMIRRTEPRLFTERQVALLKTFADQAVIAIENVRLFNETKESLEKQTATSEILSIIARTPTDVQPVFDAIAASAARLCQAYDAALFRLDG